MAVNIDVVAEKVFNLLAGSGYEISSLNSEGEKVIDPVEASRFVVNQPNILVRLDKATETLSMGVREDYDNDNLRDGLKHLANDYLMNFDFRIFGKALRPKSETIDIAKRSEKKMGDVLEALNELRKRAGLEIHESEVGSGFQDPEKSGKKLNEFQYDSSTIQYVDSFMTDQLQQFRRNRNVGEIILPDNMERNIDNVIRKDRRLSRQEANQLILAWIRNHVRESVEVGENTKDEQLPHCELCKGKGCDACDNTGEEDGYIHRDIDEAATMTKNGCTVYTDGSPLSFSDWRSETERETGHPMKRSPEDQKLAYTQYVRRCNESVWENISEGFSSMSGSSKTSYQGLDNVKLIVRHKKEVNEEVRGSRSRNIHSIFIQRGDERFKMAENNLKAARAMARHVKNGGEPFDTVGSAINEMATEQKKLREFVRYVKKSGLVNEENETYVNIAVENINSITSAFTKLAGVKSYANAVEHVSDRVTSEIIQDDIDLESQFTETHFDNRVASVQDSIKSAIFRKTQFESSIDRAVSKESFASLKNMLSEDDGMEFATPHAKLGYQVGQMSTSVADSRLGSYLTGISKKLYSGDRMSQHEYTTIKSCLLGAHAGHEVPTSVAESVEDQYEKFIEQFDIL
ncbi:hypothetical protein N9I83_01625 [bacterium]|nr:hypothetical protein [bacterium]